MRAICSHCFHSKITYVQGRERIGCLRPRALPDGAILHAPRDGYEAVVERLPESDLDWRKVGDRCGPDAKNFKDGSHA